MLRMMMNSKIHRATVTQADLNYVGSITIDEDILDAVGMLANEKYMSLIIIMALVLKHILLLVNEVQV